MINDKWDLNPNPLSEEDRRRIMARIHSLLFWLGKFIPEEELLEGQRIPLREIVFNFISKAEPSEEEVEDAMSLAAAQSQGLGAGAQLQADVQGRGTHAP